MRKIRSSLFAISLILISIGIVMVYSTSSVYAAENLGDSLFFLKRQLMFVVIGSIFMMLVMSFDYRKLQPLSRMLVLSSFVLLTLVLIPGIGREIAGARRWFRLFGISFQPSELSQLIIILYLADFLARKRRFIENFFKGVAPPLFVLGLNCLLILIEPDLGTAFALFSVGLVMLFIAGANIKHLGLILGLGVIFFYILIFSVPYRRARILAFINPWADPQGSGFQMVQAQIALGSGGLFGVGLGLGKEKLFYLPAAHTDFIFSIIGEELGLLGTLSIVGLYIILFVQGLRMIRFLRDDFGRFLVMGIVFLLALYTVINISVNLGLLPTKGLPLPFISYGGTSLVIHMIALALVLNVSRFSEEYE